MGGVIKYGLALSLLLVAVARAAAPSAYVLCALKGDAFDSACQFAERRLRDAGYEVHRLDGPDFRNRAAFEASLRTADRPLIYLIGHGTALQSGAHQLHLGRDGAARSYPTSVLLEQVRRLNPSAQVFVDSCQSGQVRAQLPGGCVGTSCRADEYSPVRRGEREVESMTFGPILELLNLPANDFKYWSGGKCEIGGDALRDYLATRLQGGDVHLSCEVVGFENGLRRSGDQIRRDEENCQRKIDELERENGVRVRTETQYQFQVQCRDFLPGQTLLLFDSLASREALLERLNAARPPDLPPVTPIKTAAGDKYYARELAGFGCEPVPGFVSKRYAAHVFFRARREGQPSVVYGDHLQDPRVRAAVMPWALRWEGRAPSSAGDDRREGTLPGPYDEDPPARTVARVEAVRGTATPDFGTMVFRHARCQEGEYQRHARGAGLSLRAHAGALEP